MNHQTIIEILSNKIFKINDEADLMFLDTQKSHLKMNITACQTKKHFKKDNPKFKQKYLKKNYGCTTVYLENNGYID